MSSTSVAETRTRNDHACSQTAKAVNIVDACLDATMNSYPAELIVQLAPVMFVAGLDTAAGNQRRQTVSTPSPDAAGGPSAPRAHTKQDPFAILAARIRDALASQRRPAVWAPEAARKSKAFQVVFVDKVLSSGSLAYCTNILLRVLSLFRIFNFHLESYLRPLTRLTNTTIFKHAPLCLPSMYPLPSIQMASLRLFGFASTLL